tara:strand:+ start:22 stop:423 length:402 start_codon:yes stop_codon:yes gene_type:complete
MPGSARQNSMFKKTEGYVQGGNPLPVTSCGRRRNLGSPLHSNEPRKTTKGKGRNFRTVEEGAGMTSKGVKEYRRKTLAVNLKQLLQEKLNQVVKMQKEENHSALDPKVGLAKEVRLLDVDGNVNNKKNKLWDM